MTLNSVKNNISNLPKNIDALQMLRAGAALLVVFWHSHLVTKSLAMNYWPDGDAVFRATHYPSYFNHLYLGVDIFFCISGFIMGMLMSKLGEKPRTSLHFLAYRMIRIFPPYWLFTGLVIVAFFGSQGKFNLGHFSENRFENIEKIISSIFLIPQSDVPILGVGWTLIHEFAFYILCSVVIAIGFRRQLPLVLVIFSAISIAFSIQGIVIWYGYCFSPFYVEFLAGALCYEFVTMTSRRAPRMQIIAGLLCFFLLCYVLDRANLGGNSLVVRCIGSSVVGYLLISGLIGMNATSSMHNSAFGKASIRIGNSSYTLYLFHWFILSFAGKIIGLMPNIPIFLAIFWHILSVIAAIVLSVIISEKIEMPLHRKMVQYFKLSIA